jgi:ATP-binding cassette subfamily B protein
MEAMFLPVDTPAEVVDAPNAPALVVTDGHVRFEEVAFGYEPERIILKGVTLDVPCRDQPGGGRAIGRGQVDPRPAALPILRPDRGRITIDGQDIAR